jgi:ABC-type branched-subunit amino acid transport system ATPase component
MAEKILEVLQEIQKKGRVVVFIEHDISTVRRIATRVVVMDQGKVVAEGRPDVILESPRIREAFLG